MIQNLKLNEDDYTNMAMNLAIFKHPKADEILEKTTTTITNPDKQKRFELEYFQIADEATLLPCIRKNKNKNYRIFIAVFVNKIRLIDTISVN